MKIKNFMIWHPHRQSSGKQDSKTWLRRAVYKLVKLYEKLTRGKEQLPHYHLRNKHSLKGRQVDSLERLNSKTNVPLSLGEGGTARVFLGRRQNEFLAIKELLKSKEQARTEGLQQADAALSAYKAMGFIDEKQVKEAQVKADQQLGQMNTLEDECRLAQKCDSEYVITPTIVDGQQVAPAHGQMLRELFETRSDGDKVIRKPLEEKMCGKLFKQALLAVKSAHDKGIAHCDIKPENLLVDGVGRLRLVDFGVGATCR